MTIIYSQYEKINNRVIFTLHERNSLISSQPIKAKPLCISRLLHEIKTTFRPVSTMVDEQAGRIFYEKQKNEAPTALCQQYQAERHNTHSCHKAINGNMMFAVLTGGRK